MHCLSSASLRSLLPNWIQTLWISEGEQSRERLEQIVPNAASPYTRTEPAVYQFQNTEVKKPRPVCNSNQTEKGRASRISPFKNYSSVFFLKRASLFWCCFLTLQPSENRSRNVSTQSDGNTDSKIIMLPYIPPNIQLVKGRIISVGARNTDIRLVNQYIWKAALNILPNISQKTGPPVGLFLVPFHSQARYFLMAS